MLTVVCADKGSPGATTAALGLAATASGPATCVEADPAGGDLGLRLRTGRGDVLPHQPTILSLASASVLSDIEAVHSHVIDLDNQLSVVPGVLMAEQLAGVARSWDSLGAALARAERQVVCDLGRLTRSSSVWPVLRHAAHVVVVGRADVESAVRLRDRVGAVTAGVAEQTGTPPRVWVAVVASRRRAKAACADVRVLLDATAAGALVGDVHAVPWDVRGAADLCTGRSNRGRRSALGRSLGRLSAELAPVPEVVT